MQIEGRTEQAWLIGRLLTVTVIVVTFIVVFTSTPHFGELSGASVDVSRSSKLNGQSTEATEVQFLVDALHSASGSIDERGLAVALDFAERFMPNRKLREASPEPSSESSTSTDGRQSQPRTTPLTAIEFPEDSPLDRVSRIR